MSSIKLNEKITAFKNKLYLGRNKLLKLDISMFPLVETLYGNTDPDNSLLEIIDEHLENLVEKFENYFLAQNSVPDWIVNSFLSPMNVDDDLKIQESLIELKSSQSVLISFKNRTIMEFWCELRTVYPLLSSIALENLIPFHTTYLCETAISHLAFLKSKYRNRLKVQDNFRIALSETKPHIDILISKMQEQKSH